MPVPRTAADSAARLRRTARLEVPQDQWRTVDRAVGLLAGHLRCSLAESQAQMIQVAREEHRELAQVAAAAIRLLDVPARDHAGDEPTDLAELLRGSADAPHRRAEHESAATRGWLDAHHADDLAADLRAHLNRTVDAAAVVIAVTAPDGTVECVGAAGVAPAAVRQWQAIAPNSGTDVSAVVHNGEPLWLSDAERVPPPYRILDHLTGRWGARAWLPVYEDNQVVGAVGVLWSVARDLDLAVQAEVRRTLAARERGLRRLLTTPTGGAAPVRWAAGMHAVLSLLGIPAALVTPVRDQRGRVLDFRCDAVSPAAVDPLGRRGAALLGVRVLQNYPGLRDTPLWPALRETLMTGYGRTVGVPVYQDLFASPDAAPDATVHLRRFGDGVLATWTMSHAEPATVERLLEVERLGNLGWGEWDVETGERRWSPQLYRIFGRDPADGPVPLEELSALALPEDAEMSAVAAADLLERGRPMDVTYRVRVGGRVKILRAVGEAVRDTVGRPVWIYGLVQDVTRPERARQRLEQGRRRLVEQHRAEEAERRLTLQVQRSILPQWRQTVPLPGLRVAARYWPAGPSAPAGGDWYDATELPDHTALLVVGDVAGRGLLATTTMAHLRASLKALAAHTGDPARLLTGLNRILLDAADDVTASVAVARFHPPSGVLTWAQAGNPAALLVHRGRVRTLERPAGMVLGIERDARYDTATHQLHPDDLLVLYTDGLVHQPGRSLRQGHAALRRATRAAAGAAEPTVALLDQLPATDLADDGCLLVARCVPGPTNDAGPETAPAPARVRAPVPAPRRSGGAGPPDEPVPGRGSPAQPPAGESLDLARAPAGESLDLARAPARESLDLARAPARESLDLAELRFERDGLEAVRRRAAAVARDSGLGDIPAYKFVLAVVEMATNAVRHGGGRGHVRFRRDATALVVEITDRGPGIPRQWRGPTRPPRPDRIGGSGLWLVRQICDTVDLDTGPGGTRVTLRFPLPEASPG